MKAKTNLTLMQSFLILLETIIMMNEKEYNFDPQVFVLGEKDDKIWSTIKEDFAKNFVRFSCLESYPGLINL